MMPIENNSARDLESYDMSADNEAEPSEYDKNHGFSGQSVRNSAISTMTYETADNNEENG